MGVSVRTHCPVRIHSSQESFIEDSSEDMCKTVWMCVCVCVCVCVCIRVCVCVCVCGCRGRVGEIAGRRMKSGGRSMEGSSQSEQPTFIVSNRKFLRTLG